MARSPRVDVGGYAYHILNRTAGRWRMFRKDGDFEAFERVLEQAVERSGDDVRLLTYCLMGKKRCRIPLFLVTSGEETVSDTVVLGDERIIPMTYLNQSATISACRAYRYDLHRVWDESLDRCCWIREGKGGRKRGKEKGRKRGRESITHFP